MIGLISGMLFALVTGECALDHFLDGLLPQGLVREIIDSLLVLNEVSPFPIDYISAM